jgi:hypothetical protein
VKYYTGQLIEVLLEAYKNASAIISLPAEAHPAAGQYLLINQSEANQEAVPLTFFPAMNEKDRDDPDQLFLTGHLPTDWEPGMSLAIRGPLGIPIKVPKETQSLALLAMGSSSSRLFPFLKEALDQSLEVVLLANQLPVNLPDQVEFLNLNQINKIVKWADYLIFDMPIINDLNVVDQLLNLNLTKHSNGIVLFSGSFPCGGLADCGICSVAHSGKTHLACKAGPALKIGNILS